MPEAKNRRNRENDEKRLRSSEFKRFTQRIARVALPATAAVAAFLMGTSAKAGAQESDTRPVVPGIVVPVGEGANVPESASGILRASSADSEVGTDDCDPGSYNNPNGAFYANNPVAQLTEELGKDGKISSDDSQAILREFVDTLLQDPNSRSVLATLDAALTKGGMLAPAEMADVKHPSDWTEADCQLARARVIVQLNTGEYQIAVGVKGEGMTNMRDKMTEQGSNEFLEALIERPGEEVTIDFYDKDGNLITKFLVVCLNPQTKSFEVVLIEGEDNRPVQPVTTQPDEKPTRPKPPADSSKPTATTQPTYSVTTRPPSTTIITSGFGTTTTTTTTEPPVTTTTEPPVTTTTTEPPVTTTTTEPPVTTTTTEPPVTTTTTEPPVTTTTTEPPVTTTTTEPPVTTTTTEPPVTTTTTEPPVTTTTTEPPVTTTVPKNANNSSGTDEPGGSNTVDQSGSTEQPSQNTGVQSPDSGRSDEGQTGEPIPDQNSPSTTGVIAQGDQSQDSQDSEVSDTTGSSQPVSGGNASTVQEDNTEVSAPDNAPNLIVDPSEQPNEMAVGGLLLSSSFAFAFAFDGFARRRYERARDTKDRLKASQYVVNTRIYFSRLGRAAIGSTK